MSAQAKQFHLWAAETDYPLSAREDLPASAILDVRAFTRIPPEGRLMLTSITGAGDSLVVNFEIAMAPVDVGTISFAVAVDTTDLRAGTVTEVSASSSYDSPWLPGEDFVLAGLLVTFGPGILDMSGWAPISPLELEPALLVDLSPFSLYRLRVRRVVEGVSSLVDIGGDVVLADGHNMSVIPDPVNNRITFEVERGYGSGMHTPGWPLYEETGPCTGLVLTIDGAPPNSGGIMAFRGEGGVEIDSDAPSHTLTLRVARASQSGTRCP